ncbi:MAG: metallophosphoesterase [Phenylobacterium sp.]|uniref:metallophosphoesterase n=1 Tax=Phenylobacterium sp. TaxID=1871053 RepID=UPI0027335611|nr:metallophosphoesterase [Phenylobacterium sp.]MDP3173066.1 metallophosphoesterase [Phenylobacterium sp.]
MSHDIIGDIHGHADRLEALLQALGYRRLNGAWRHPARTAVFVGDLIDRGPGQLRTLELVRAMIDAGSARAVMGNHELNAIAWATPHADIEGDHLRTRMGPKGEKNRHQHAAFLSEVGADTPEHRAWIDWFYQLPLWIEESSFRVVHACWSPGHAAVLKSHLGDQGRLTPGDIDAASRPGSAIHDAVDTLLKGVEVELPGGATFTDKDGHVRNAIRTRWWDPQLVSLGEAYIGPSGIVLPDGDIPPDSRIEEPDRPTFIGHYWFDPEGPPAPASRRVACVDYSVAKGGPLVSYRFDGAPALSAAHFVAV